ncbi:PEPxxWA-CTERM sorting domain-containing protein [Sandarakinorhabdus sp.]|uniref:PEPxxWA-CTERM sorting domain-containing protein n=1 Tax=Sandarakinorhabdus sp. TaxID=1916663 RepID=UPI003F7166E1
MKSLLLLVTAATLLSAAPAAAITGFTLANTNEGDGFVIELSSVRFDLFSSNNFQFDVLTTYSAVATTNFTLSGQFRYLTRDIDGSNFDRAGYFINNDFVQLSQDDMLQYSYNFGTYSFDVQAGDTYGFYMFSNDSFGGRAILTIGAIPEPSSWAMLIAGFGLVGASLRRHRAIAA